MAMEITAMASPSPRPSLPTPSTSPHPVTTFCKPPQLKRPHISLPTSTTISLLALFAPPNEARAAVSISKDQIVSSLTQVEQTIDQVQEAGSGFLDTAQRVAEAIGNVLKPGIDAALPIVQQAGDEAFKIASPAFSEASKKAQEALQSSGLDTEPVLSAAKTVADAAQQTTKVIEGAKPIASSTVETISSSDPTVIAGTAGALFAAYLLLPPIWSAISFNLRGYKGELTPAQTLDMLCTQNYVLIDIRSEKDKDKAGIPRLPSSAKNKMVAIPPIRENTGRLSTFSESPSRIRCSVDTPYGGNVQKFPRISVWDPYRRLGVTRDASEEEIWGSRNFLVQQYAGHERSVESIEAAFEKILMASFIQRKKTKINLKSKLKKKVEESPTWVKNLLNTVEFPPTEIILRRLFFFAFMGGWSIMNSAETGPAFQVAISLAACVYFLHEKTKSLARAIIIGFGALVAGWVSGSILVPNIPSMLLRPTWTLELLTSLVVYFFLFLGCTFLK